MAELKFGPTTGTEKGDTIRIISARRATRRERQTYEENP
jgi:uncharacterized DUF497 family protein